MFLQNASAVQEVCSGEAVSESVSYLDVHFKKYFTYVLVHACARLCVHVCVCSCVYVSIDTDQKRALDPLQRTLQIA